MIEVEIKNNDGQYRNMLSKGEGDAVLVFYLKNKSISMDCVGINNLEFLKECKKEIPKVIEKAISEQSVKVKKENK